MQRKQQQKYPAQDKTDAPWKKILDQGIALHTQAQHCGQAGDTEGQIEAFPAPEKVEKQMVDADQKDSAQRRGHCGALPENVVGENRIPSYEKRIKDPASIHSKVGCLNNQLQDAVLRSGRQQLIAHTGDRIFI